MLRDPSLVPLSHQHHNGLALCVLTRRSLAADRSPENLAALARRIGDRYELELVNHFDLEERELFPAVLAHAPLQGTIRQLVEQHRAIAALAASIARAPSPEQIEEFCALLSAHIRREESGLFEEAQRRLPRAVLDRLGPIFAARAVRICL